VLISRFDFDDRFTAAFEDVLYFATEGNRVLRTWSLLCAKGRERSERRRERCQRGETEGGSRT